MPDLPTGTITFLFTDIEGSTRLWEQDPEAMRTALLRHDVLLRQSIEAHHGIVFKTLGDAFCAAFVGVAEAAEAALAIQRALNAEPPVLSKVGEALALRVRMALHTGTAELREDDYFGPVLNRLARLLAIGHGGQVLVSSVTQGLLAELLPPEASLRDLGLHRLRDLQTPEHVWQIGTAELPEEFPPLRSLEAFANNLPQQVTSFIGREKEIDAVQRLLKSSRLLTLTGAGGTGKTRLALQVAADLLETYEDGVWLVELAPLSDPALAAQTVAAVLNIKEEAGRPLLQSLVDYLTSKRLLLLLDNCEHLLLACAQLAEALLRACPRLCILATSRESLHIQGETTYYIPSLGLPPREYLSTLSRPAKTAPGAPPPDSPDQRSRWDDLYQYEAVHLFVDRAIAVHPGFTLNAANAPFLAQLCHRLDGIPFAIELAAARVRALSVEQIAARLNDRFRLLTGGSRTALPRQQTLRALIDWSYDLLTEAEKTLLCCLSVFVGGWTLEAAEAVCTETGNWEILDLLTQLVDKSLVVYEEQAGQGRYRMLETMRQYGEEKLRAAGGEEGVRVRHLDWFLALAEAAEPELQGPEQAAWLNRLEMEHDNLRAALKACPDSERRLRLAGALHRFWWVRGYLSEGRGWLEEALNQGADAPEMVQGKALNGAGILAWTQGDHTAAQRFYEACLAIKQKLGDRQGVAGLLSNLGSLAASQGDLAGARSRLEESLALFEALDDPARVGMVLNNLGAIAIYQADYTAAKSYLEACLTIHRALDNRLSIAQALHNLGEIALRQQEHATAQQRFQESLAIQRELGDRSIMVSSLVSLANAMIAQGAYARATGLFAAAEALGETIGVSYRPDDPASYERDLATARATLGEAIFARTWQEGRAMLPEQVLAYALEPEKTLDTTGHL